MLADLVVVNDFFLVPFLCSTRLGWIGRAFPNLFISHIQHTYFTPFFI